MKKIVGRRKYWILPSMLFLTIIGMIYLDSVTNNTIKDMFGNSSVLVYQPEFRYLIEPNNLSCSNKPPRILIVVKSALNEFEERTVIRSTWMRQALRYEIAVLFSVGYSDNSTLNDLLTAESNRYGDILQTNFLETYHHLTLKSYSNIRWIVEYCSKTRFVFVTDSDVIVFPANLMKLAHSLAVRNNTLGGHCWLGGANPVRDNSSKSYMPYTAWPEDKYPPYCSGTGYFMTGDVPKKLLQAVPGGVDNWQWANNLDHLEDVVFTGLLTSLANVTLQHTNNIVYNEHHSHDVCHTISVHSFRPPKVFVKNFNAFQTRLKMCQNVVHKP